MSKTSIDLRRPPRGSGDEAGGICIIDFRMLSIRVGKVDTVTGDTYIKLACVFYWTDERLANKPQYAGGEPLPGDLWGPTLLLVNSRMRPEINQTAFVLDNAETGRLKRQLIYEATIDNPMSLHNFPFDMDAVEVYFMSSSDWMSLDMTARGNVARGRTYRLREMPEANGEGQFFRLCWNGEIPEWMLVGTSYVLKENPPNANGAEVTNVSINFHLVRKWTYYGYKIMVPLYLLVASSFTVFTIDPQYPLERKEMTNNMIMAVCGLLFVVASELPRLDFLTSIDAVVLSSVVVIVLQSFAVTIAGTWCQSLVYYLGIGEDAADSELYAGVSGECEKYNDALVLDKAVTYSVLSVFIAFQLYVIIPPLRRRRRCIELFATMTEDGWNHGTRQNRIELQNRFPDVMGSLTPQEPEPGMRDYSVSHRHADGIFQFGQPEFKHLPGADAPASPGSSGCEKVRKLNDDINVTTKPTMKKMALKMRSARRLLQNTRLHKRVVPANNVISKVQRHSMYTGSDSPTRRASDSNVRGSLRPFVMDMHNIDQDTSANSNTNNITNNDDAQTPTQTQTQTQTHNQVGE